MGEVVYGGSEMSEEWMEEITKAICTLLEVCVDEGREFTHEQADRIREIIEDNEHHYDFTRDCERCRSREKYQREVEK
jgi:hypothetical protein